jgi:uncharacterized membrane protein
MMIIAFILVGALVYYTFNSNSNNNHNSNGTFSNTRNNTNPVNYINPMDILNERFAKGEIDEAEYMKKKDLLNQ